MPNDDPSQYLNKVYTHIKLEPTEDSVGKIRLRLRPRLALGALVWMLLYSLYQWMH